MPRALPYSPRLRFVDQPEGEPNGSGTSTPDGEDQEQPGTPPATPEAPEPEDDGGEEPKDWKASSRFWERRSKANAEAAKRLPDVEAERDRLAAELADLKVASLRTKVAAAHGISDQDAQMFLTATTEPDLTVQAKRLAGLRGGLLYDPTAGKTPDLDPGDDAAVVRALFGTT